MGHSLAVYLKLVDEHQERCKIAEREGMLFNHLGAVVLAAMIYR